VGWTVYVLFLGTAFLLVPNVLLSIFQIAETDDVWIRVIGMLFLGWPLDVACTAFGTGIGDVIVPDRIVFPRYLIDRCNGCCSVSLLQSS
jgi:hypothetical protein